MSPAWRRLLTLLLALLLPLQGLARPCETAGHGAAVPCAAAVHDGGQVAGQHHAGTALDAAPVHGASATGSTPCDADGGHALPGSCSVCAACCAGLALPSAAPVPAMSAPAVAGAVPVVVPNDAGVPARLDRPPRSAAT